VSNQDVFISYSGGDLPYVERIVLLLEAEGLACWYSDRDNPSYQSDIKEEMIKKCPVFLLIASMYSMYSLDVQNEINLVLQTENARIELKVAELPDRDRTELFKAFASKSKRFEWDYVFPAIQEIKNLVNPTPYELGSGVGYGYYVRPAPRKSTLRRIYDFLGLKASLAIILFIVGGVITVAGIAYDATFPSTPQVNVFEDEFTRLIRLAEEGNASAQFDLGLDYLFGNGVGQDDERAMYWFRRAAEQGRSYAQVNLGWMYDHGMSTPANLDLAMYWYRKAAEQGCMTGQNLLGAMYWNRIDTPNYEQAVYWFRKAAEQGFAASQTSLGWMYYAGLGLIQDYEQMLYWYKEAAGQDYPWALISLGTIYLEGIGVKPNNETALYWFRRAAMLGNSEGQNALGYMFLRGYGVPQDDEQAVYWYRLAAEQGHDNAQHNLALMYQDGRGTEQSIEQAIYWFEKSASVGNVSAANALEQLLILFPTR
jgi:TPR repeat protein